MSKFKDAVRKIGLADVFFVVGMVFLGAGLWNWVNPWASLSVCGFLLMSLGIIGSR